MNATSLAAKLCLLLGLLSFSFHQVAAQEAVPSAKELASQLSANMQDGSSLIRLRMDFTSTAGAKTVLQLQIKSRRTRGATDIVYQVLFPKERKGESVLLQKSSKGVSGKLFLPASGVQSISSGQMKESLFGSALSYEDIIDNFFTWEQQTIVGTEEVDRVACQILESKSGGGSSYSRVRSWIDVKRMVPLRVEKYSSSGQLAKRIETTRVAKDDTDRQVPASLRVQRSGEAAATEIEGSNSRHDVSYEDSIFTAEGIQVLAPPTSAKK
jgi:hypothetical protein